jgi:hypothetical protein
MYKWIMDKLYTNFFTILKAINFYVKLILVLLYINNIIHHTSCFQGKKKYIYRIISFCNVKKKGDIWY